MNDTPTPRTDAESFLSRGMGIVPTLPKEAVRIDFARQLERELTAVTEQRDRLDDQLDHILLRLGRTQERMIDAERQRDRLEAEIRLTIMENVHLADGDLCTLKRLKDAIGFEFNEALQPLKPTEP